MLDLRQSNPGPLQPSSRMTMDCSGRLPCFESPKPKSTSEDVAGKLKTSSTPYKPLDGKKQEIRLLLIKPATRTEDAVRCRLETRSLKDNPEYGALSYVWGDPRNTRSIHINSAEMGVAENLFSALQYLRRPDEVVTLWVDAICINQSDDIERNSQVRQMHQIFASADVVHAWLGDESNISRDVFDMIHDWMSVTEVDPGDAVDTKTILDFEQPYWHKWRDELRTKLHQDSSFSASCSSDPRLPLLPWITQHPYWKRLWIQQELVLARRVELQSGNAKMSLRRYVRFHILLDLIEEKQNFFESTLPPITVSHDTIAYLQSLKFDHLPRLVNNFRSFNCSDERDLLYGLLGLYNGPNTPVEVRYDHPVETVYSDYFLWIAMHHQELAIDGSNGITTWNGLEPRRESLPSWVSDLVTIVPLDVFHYDPQYIGAAGGTPPRFHVDRRTMTLESHAFIIDRIQDHSSFRCEPVRSLESTLIHFLEEKIGKSHREQGNCFKDVFLSVTELIFQGTIHASSLLEALGFCAWISLHYEQLPECEHHAQFVEFQERYDIDEERVTPEVVPLLRFMQLTGYVGAAREFCDTYGRDEGLAHLAEPKNLKSYWEDFLDITNRTKMKSFDLFRARDIWLAELAGDKPDWDLFITENGHIGKSPLGIVKGDEICILPGCRMPLILWKRGENHVVVTARPINGMMKGEIMKLAQEGKFKECTIRLV